MAAAVGIQHQPRGTAARRRARAQLHRRLAQAQPLLAAGDLDDCLVTRYLQHPHRALALARRQAARRAAIDHQQRLAAQNAGQRNRLRAGQR